MTLVKRLNEALHPLGAAVRSETAADLPFAAALFASTRSKELAPVPWTQAQKDDFCQQQFELQHAHYAKHYAQVNFLIVETLTPATPLGRVYVNDAPQEIGLMEITLDPASRQRGLGTAIIQSLLALAQHTSRTVLLYVEPDNPARRLYERAGFVKVDEQGLYMRMRWAPNTMARIS